MTFAIHRVSLCLLACLAIAACETISEKRKIDYRAAQARTLPPLDVPPDLAVIPEVNSPKPTQAATYSGFISDQQSPTGSAAATGLLAQVPNMHIERDRQARWLVVQASPEGLWARVRQFISSVGLNIERENATTGVIETGWAENRAKAGSDTQAFFAKWFGTLYSTGMRDKIHIRLERGAQPETTEIYLAHRGMQELLVQNRSGEPEGTTRWQARASEPELEAEMLRLLMVYLGKTEEQSQAIVAQTPVPAAERAHLGRSNGEVSLSLEDSLDRAWRRVGLSLDRAGFTVEDRDRSKGIYYVRYIDPDQDKSRPGFFARMFGAEDEKPEERFQVQLEASSAGTNVAVKRQDGTPQPGKTGERILGLLYEQLK